MSVQTILGGMGVFLIASSAQAASNKPIGIGAAAKMGTLVSAQPGALAIIRAPATTMLFAVEGETRRRVFGTPSESGKTMMYDLGAGQYWDASTSRSFRIVPRTAVES